MHFFFLREMVKKTVRNSSRYEFKKERHIPPMGGYHQTFFLFPKLASKQLLACGGMTVAAAVVVSDSLTLFTSLP